MALRTYFQKDYFKPLSHFFETKEKTHARTLRTTFGQKFMDTWKMWSGSPAILLKQRGAKAGLLDYAMLHIPSFIGLIKAGLIEMYDKALEYPALLLPYFLLFSAPLLAIVILDTTFDLIKQTIGLLLTIVSLPFIGIVQAITYGAAHKEYVEMQREIQETFGAQTTNLHLYVNGCGLMKDTQHTGLTYELEKFMVNLKQDVLIYQEQSDLLIYSDAKKNTNWSIKRTEKNGELFNKLKELCIDEYKNADKDTLKDISDFISQSETKDGKETYQKNYTDNDTLVGGIQLVSNGNAEKMKPFGSIPMVKDTAYCRFNYGHGRGNFGIKKQVEQIETRQLIL